MIKLLSASVLAIVLATSAMAQTSGSGNGDGTGATTGTTGTGGATGTGSNNGTVDPNATNSTNSTKSNGANDRCKDAAGNDIEGGLFIFLPFGRAATDHIPRSGT